jgi:hypothetical protein
MKITLMFKIKPDIPGNKRLPGPGFTRRIKQIETTEFSGEKIPRIIVPHCPRQFPVTQYFLYGQAPLTITAIQQVQLED